jgi:hypothetical protein
MTERKPPKERWDSFVERQIRQAQEQGEFDALSGFGQPCESIDEPITEDWWLKKKIKRERLTLLPPSLEIKRDIETTLQRINNMSSVDRVRRELTSLNDRIRKANFASVWGPASTVMELDVQLYLGRWKSRRDKSGGGPG